MQRHRASTEILRLILYIAGMNACIVPLDALQQHERIEFAHPAQSAPRLALKKCRRTMQMLVWCGVVLLGALSVSPAFASLSFAPSSKAQQNEKQGKEKRAKQKRQTTKQLKKETQKEAAKPRTTAPPQTSISTEQRKLQRLQRQIEQDRERLKSAREREGAVSGKLTKQRRKSKEVQTSIQILTYQMRRTQDSLLKTSTNLGGLQQRLRTLEREYARLCRRVVRRGEPSDEERVVLALAPDDDLATRAVLRSVHRVSVRRAEEIGDLMDSLSGRKHSLELFLSNRETLKSSEEHRARRIGQSIELSEKALDSIRSNKKLLQQKLEERNASVRKVQQMIAALVAEEIRRKKEEARRRAEAEKRGKKGSTAANATAKGKHSRGDDVDESSAKAEFRGVLAGKFRPHSLPWPTASHKILHGFGQYTNPITGTVINNPGLSIEAPYGTPMQCVADGVVSLVHWLPGYGSLVIVDHGNDFRTVYANMASVAVKEGVRVEAGSIVGKSGRSVDGEYAHFEVWRDREKLNPATWLK
jgi:septal ring factor EnvC (AmiA/AmiB activator)